MSGETWRTEAEELRVLAPRHVLFLCVANSARSQMAEGIARSLAPAGVTVCPVFLGKARRIHWGVPDPAGAGRTEEEQLQAFREVRDELRRRLSVVFSR